MEAPVEQKGEVTMKLGICEWVLPIKGPSLFPKLKELGIDGIQVDDWDGHAACNPMCDPYVQSLYLENADKYGIENRAEILKQKTPVNICLPESLTI